MQILLFFLLATFSGSVLSYTGNFSANVDNGLDAQPYDWSVAAEGKPLADKIYTSEDGSLVEVRGELASGRQKLGKRDRYGFLDFYTVEVLNKEKTEKILIGKNISINGLKEGYELVGADTAVAVYDKHGLKYASLCKAYKDGPFEERQACLSIDYKVCDEVFATLEVEPGFFNKNIANGASKLKKCLADDNVQEFLKKLKRIGKKSDEISAKMSKKVSPFMQDSYLPVKDAPSEIKGKYPLQMNELSSFDLAKDVFTLDRMGSLCKQYKKALAHRYHTLIIEQEGQRPAKSSANRATKE